MRAHGSDGGRELGPAYIAGGGALPLQPVRRAESAVAAFPDLRRPFDTYRTATGYEILQAVHALPRAELQQVATHLEGEIDHAEPASTNGRAERIRLEHLKTLLQWVEAARERDPPDRPAWTGYQSLWDFRCFQHELVGLDAAYQEALAGWTAGNGAGVQTHRAGRLMAATNALEAAVIGMEVGAVDNACKAAQRAFLADWTAHYAIASREDREKDFARAVGQSRRMLDLMLLARTVRGAYGTLDQHLMPAMVARPLKHARELEAPVRQALARQTFFDHYGLFETLQANARDVPRKVPVPAFGQPGPDAFEFALYAFGLVTKLQPAMIEHMIGERMMRGDVAEGVTPDAPVARDMAAWDALRVNQAVDERELRYLDDVFSVLAAHTLQVDKHMEAVADSMQALTFDVGQLPAKPPHYFEELIPTVVDFSRRVHLRPAYDLPIERLAVQHEVAALEVNTRQWMVRADEPGSGEARAAAVDSLLEPGAEQRAYVWITANGPNLTTLPMAPDF